jgi:hypothetical protein
MNHLVRLAYEMGKNAAASNFKLDPKSTVPGTPKTVIPPIQASNPVQPVAQQATQDALSATNQHADKTIAPLAKRAAFNFGLYPKSKPGPGEITLDNGTRTLGTNFSEPWKQNRNVGKAFDNMKPQMPQDFLNFGNEGSVGGPTT